MKKIFALLLVTASVLSHAWEPTKPVTIIIGNAPGAGNEIAARKLAGIVEKSNPKVSFVVQNMPGADSVISMNHFLTVPPDGYTIAIPSHMSTYVTNDIWEKSVKKFAYNEFTDVLTIGKSPLVLVASSVSKINTPEEFVKLVSTTTKPISVALGGGAHRTAFEYLMEKNNGNKDMVKPVKFNGPLQAVTSVAQFATAGGTEFGIMPIAIAQPLYQAGKVKLIGFTGTKSMPQYPNVPFLNRVAPGINVYAAWTLALPPNTPKDIVDWYKVEFGKAAVTQEYQEWMKENVIFIEPKELDPAGLRQQIEFLHKTFLPVLEKVDLSKE